MMSARSFVLSALTAVSAWPAAAVAQERQPTNRPRIYIKGDTSMIRDRIKMVTQRRARLGINVSMVPSANDSIGATIDAVTPGGPAAKAGLRSGDIITRLDGKSLVANDGRKTDENQSTPAIRLVEIASQLKARDTVSVEFRHDGTRHTVSLVTGDEPIMAFDFPNMNMGDEPDVRSFVFPRGRIETTLPRKSAQGTFEFGPGMQGWAFGSFGGPLMDLELAPLNADLGQYFGTSEGVLVIDVPRESSLGLKGGDVILSVDGRKVSNPSSLHRILRSYDPGESFKFDIMRNKSRMTVTGKLEKPREE
jgi:S1-C subfamily serine protease